MHPVELLTSGATFWWAGSSFISPRCRPMNKHTLNRKWAFICIPLCDTQGTSAVFGDYLHLQNHHWRRTEAMDRNKYVVSSYFLAHTLLHAGCCTLWVLNHTQSMLWPKKDSWHFYSAKMKILLIIKHHFSIIATPPPSPSFSPGAKLFI